MLKIDAKNEGKYEEYLDDLKTFLVRHNSIMSADALRALLDETEEVETGLAEVLEDDDEVMTLSVEGDSSYGEDESESLINF